MTSPPLLNTPGRKPRNRSWQRRRKPSTAGGPPPDDEGPRPQGPFGPPLPFPSDEFVQGIWPPLIPWFPKARRLYVHRCRGANRNALHRTWQVGQTVQGRRSDIFSMAHATRDEVL